MRRWPSLILAAGLAAACGRSPAPGPSDRSSEYGAQREAMVKFLANYSPKHHVRDPRVLEALRKVPRHEFVPPEMRAYAYSDSPLDIGEGQTISQPLIVGYMTEALELTPQDKILEVGTGSGYQAAILAELVREVYTIEIIERLGRRAEQTLKSLGYANVRVRIGDGYQGWPEAAPFDAVIVTCAPDHVPQPLVEQLKTGGRIIIPVGGSSEGSWSAQELILLRKTQSGIQREKRMDVRFVPMTGEAQRGAPKPREGASPGGVEASLPPVNRAP